MKSTMFVCWSNFSVAFIETESKFDVFFYFVDNFLKKKLSLGLFLWLNFEVSVIQDVCQRILTGNATKATQTF